MPPWPPGPRSAALRRAGAAHADARPSATRSCAGYAAGPESTAPTVGPPSTTTTASACRRDGCCDCACRRRTRPSARTARPTTTAASCSTRSSPRTSSSRPPDRAGRDALVHHVILFRVPAGERRRGRGLDAAAPGPGWSCFGGTGIAARVAPRGGSRSRQRTVDRRLGAGLGRRPAARGVGVSLPAGSRIVMQVHYNLLNGRRPDRSRAVLTTVPATPACKPLETMLLPAPVELPCAKGEPGRCAIATAALFDQVRKYGPGRRPHPRRPAAALRQGRRRTHPRPGHVLRPAARPCRPPSTRSPATCTSSAARSGSSSTPARRAPGAARHPALELPLAGVVRARDSRSQAQPGDVLRVTCRHDTACAAGATTAVPHPPLHPLGRGDDRRDVPRHRPGHTRPSARAGRARAHPPRLADVPGPDGARPRHVRRGARA